MGCGASCAQESNAAKPTEGPNKSPAATVETNAKAAIGNVVVSSSEFLDSAPKTAEVLFSDLPEKFDQAHATMQKIFEEEPGNPLHVAVDVVKSAISLLPEVGEVLVTIANVAIPPPGGQVLAIVLRIGALIVTDGRNAMFADGLAKEASATMCLVFNGIQLNKHKNLLPALQELREVCTEIEKFIEQAVTGKMWIRRMLQWTSTMETLNKYQQQLDKVRSMLGLAASITAIKMIEKIKEEADEFSSKYKEALQSAGVTDESDLQSNPDALKRVATSLKGSGSQEIQIVIEMLNAVIAGKGAESYTWINHRAIKSLWKVWIRDKQNIKWTEFWNYFPKQLPNDDVPTKDQLQTFFDQPPNRAALQSYIEDFEDPETVSINEINTWFQEQDEIFEKAKSIVEAYREKGLGARDVVLPDKYISRPCVERLAKNVMGSRVVMVTGWPGEGKYVTACAAVLELKQQKAIAAGYVVQLQNCKTADDIDGRLLDGLKSRQPVGDRWESVMTALRGIQAMSTDEKPCHAVTILNGLGDVPNDLMRHLIDRFKTMLTEVRHMHLVMCTRNNINKDSWGEHQLDPDKVNWFLLEPLRPENAAALLKKHVTLYDIDEEHSKDLANRWTCNPRVIELMADMINNGDFDVTGRLDYEAAKASHVEITEEDGHGMRDVLIKAFANLGKSGKDCTRFFTVCDTFEGHLDNKALSKVLEINEQSARKLLITLTQKHLLQPRSANPSKCLVMPLAKGMVRAILNSEEPETEYPTLIKYIQDAKDARCKARASFAKWLIERMADIYKTYNTEPQTAYPLIVASKDDVQTVFRWLAESDELSGDVKIRKGVLETLLLMPLTVTAFDQRAVQIACQRLAEVWGDDTLMAGVCHAVAAAFFQSTKDPDYGKPMGLQQADRAVGLLRDAPASEQQQLALAWAYLAKGLILREDNSLDPCIECLKNGREVLKELCDKGDRRARLMHVIMLSEISGALDYYDKPDTTQEGVEVGQQAVKEAEWFFNNDHPIWALAIGSLGYNLRKGGKPQEALDMHKKAYKMRESTLGSDHPETAMSINQLALSMQDLAKAQLDLADKASEGSKQREYLRESAANFLLQAEEKFELSLDIRKKCLGPSHVMVANTTLGLAQLHQLMAERLGQDERLPKAVDCLETTLKIREKSYDASNSKVQDVRTLLLTLYAKTGQADRAEQL